MRYGYVIAVTGIIEQSDEMSNGKIDEFGNVTFPVKYRAIVFKPFRMEVVDAVVDKVTRIGFYAKAGPMMIFVSQRVCAFHLQKFMIF